MSREFIIDEVPMEHKEKIMKDLQIKVEGNTFVKNSAPKYIYPLNVTDTHAYIPFAYGMSCSGGPFSRPNRDTFPNMNKKFNGSLREEQKILKREALDHLNKYGSTIIAASTGFGKTATSIYIATKIKMKTIVITHRVILVNQWKEAIKKFCPCATVQVLTAKSEMKDCDFYIMNAINVPKHDVDFYRQIGVVIVDEIHCIMAEGLSKCMTRFVPRYVIGLSATPYREDGLNILLDLYFGKNQIYRKLYRQHKVYKVRTNFVPTIEIAKNGRVNWSVILDSQSMDIQRNEMIIRIVKHFNDRVFLILCKRVSQGNYLVQRLKEEKEDVTSLIGKQQEYEQSSRILVGTASKAGTGFDHPRLDAMIMASDIQAYFIQYLGRVFRRKDVVPIVFDIVDKNPILERHFKVRRATYLEHGGAVTDFENAFPDFTL